MSEIMTRLQIEDRRVDLIQVALTDPCRNEFPTLIIIIIIFV